MLSAHFYFDRVGIQTIAPAEENCPRLGLRSESKAWLALGLGHNQTIPPEDNCLLVRVRDWLKVSFGDGGKFSSEAIVLESKEWYHLCH